MTHNHGGRLAGAPQQVWQEVVGGGGNTTSSEVQTFKTGSWLGELRRERPEAVCKAPPEPLGYSAQCPGRTLETEEKDVVFRVWWRPHVDTAAWFPKPGWPWWLRFHTVGRFPRGTTRDRSEQGSLLAKREPCGSQGPARWRPAGRNGARRRKGLGGCTVLGREQEKRRFGSAEVVWPGRAG